MSVTAFTVANFQISERVPARDLYRFVAVIENLYSWHVLLDHMDVRHVDNPVMFLPAHEEELVVNRLEIGTPNYVELLGLAQPLLDTIAWIAPIAGSALTSISVVKGYYEIRKTRAEALKVERELKVAADQSRLATEAASSRIHQPDLLLRTHLHAHAFTEEQMAQKENFVHYAQATVAELMPAFAAPPSVTLFEREES